MRTFSLFVVSLLLVSPIITSAQTAVSPDGSSLSVSELYAGGPNMPAITSNQFPDPDSWYAPVDMTFSWTLPDEVVAVAADLFTEGGKEPMTAYRPPISSITIDKDDLVEGTNYLTVQFKNDEKWGMYAERPIRIDATAPESFSINLSVLEDPAGAILIFFESRDQLSGISHYEIQVNDEPTKRLLPHEVSYGHMIGVSDAGLQKIKVTAYDMAGNSHEESVTIVATTPVAASAGNLIGMAEENPASILAAVMAAMMLLMFGYLVYERQRYAVSLTDLRRETGEIQTQLLRIFSALREEIHDQIRGITKKTRLSKGEKEAVEGLNKALSLSESLIKREIKDVKKLLD